MNRKASKYQTFVCALQSECPERNKEGEIKKRNKRPKESAHVRGLLQYITI